MARSLRPCDDVGAGGYAFVAILIPFYIKLTVELVYVPFNVNYKDMNRIVVVAMLQLANMNHGHHIE